MSVEEAGAITARTVGTLLMATWPRRILCGVVILIPAIVAAFGGFGKAEERREAIPVGTSVDLGPMTMRPVSFFVSADVNRSDLESRDGAEAYLGVIVDVENSTDEHISLTFPGPASDAVVPDLDADLFAMERTSTADAALRVVDNTNGETVLPGIPDQVALLWPITDVDAVPDVLTISMTESVWEYGVVSGEDRWLSLGDTWLMDLPRDDLPTALYEPPDEV